MVLWLHPIHVYFCISPLTSIGFSGYGFMDPFSCIFLPGSAVQFPMVSPGQEPVCVDLGKLHSLKGPPKGENDKPLLSIVYLGNPL